MPECFEVTIDRERVDVIVAHIYNLLQKTNAEKFNLILSKEKLVVQPILPRMEIVLEKEEKK